MPAWGEPDAKIGDTVTGRDVTGGGMYTGVVSEVIGPIRTPDCGGYRYKITNTGETYAGGKPFEPIVFLEENLSA